jgi:hypothetical protein
VATITSPSQVRLGLPFTVKSGVKSCATCPSAMSTKEQVANVGASVGGPTCGLKSLPILNPAARPIVQERQAEYVAKNCTSHNLPWPGFSPSAFVDPISYPIALPKPNPAIIEPDGTPRRTGTPSNCMGCANFVPATQVQEKLGFDSPLCLARGDLLLTDRLATYPNGCNDKVWHGDAEKASLDGLMINPEYSRTFGEVDVTASIRKSREVDPVNWRTEKPVTAEDTARGIRAWRKLVDPSGYAPPLYMPIFHTEYHGTRAALIPKKGGDSRPEVYTDYGGFVYKLMRLWSMNKTPALWGIPGVGKTEVLRHVAWLMNAPFIRISLTGASEIDDLVGRPQYDPARGTWFQYGRMTTAYSLPGVLALDEPNTAPDMIWQSIRALTDDSKQFVLDQHDGVIIDKHVNLFMALAMNPAWDHRNVGTNQIGDADARRLMHVTVYMPPDEVERDIIKRHCAAASGYDPSQHLDILMSVATDIRQAADNESVNFTWGIANNVKVAQLMEFFPPFEAFNIAILNYLDPQGRGLVEDILKSYYPN